ncbi:MAG TPA: alanine racemase [Clostridiales bacterium]|jgi:alanine racemase|nr:alanine racemase [Clostridiales bacterium]
MYKEGLRPAWVEIDLKALENNIKIIQSRVAPGCDVCGVVKANAYGHGMKECARIMEKNGIHTFGVSTLAEAIELREMGVKGRVIMLGLTPALFADTVLEYDILTGFIDLSFVKALSDEAVRRGKTAEVWAVIDTGMGRIGYQAKDPAIIEEIVEASKMPGIRVVGIFSHFATADEADRSFTDKQEHRFNNVRNALMDRGLSFELCSLANSPATMDRPSSHFDLCRPGGIFYGRYQSGVTFVEGIEPVLSFRANIVQLKNIPEGDSVSYERSFIAGRPSTIATLGFGYADGIPRPWSKVGRAIVNGQYAPFAGHICMDQCMLDVTDIPNVKLGDEVTIIGKSGGLEVRAEDLADALGTIGNDITCNCDSRLPYVYIE